MAFSLTCDRSLSVPLGTIPFNSMHWKLIISVLFLSNVSLSQSFDSDDGPLPILGSLFGRSEEIVERVLQNVLTSEESRRELRAFIADEVDDEEEYMTCLDCRVRAIYIFCWFNCRLKSHQWDFHPSICLSIQMYISQTAEWILVRFGLKICCIQGYIWVYHIGTVIE